MQNVQHRVCSACGNERKLRNLIYDPENMKCYCKNPYICTPKHPNDPKNIAARGSELPLVPYNEAFDIYNAKSEADDKLTTKIRRVMSSPLTVRVKNVDTARYIAILALDLDSTGEAVRYCIEKMMELYPHGVPDPVVAPPIEPAPVIVEPEPEPAPEEPVIEEEEEEEDTGGGWAF